MQRQISTLDFKGQNIFVGIDVHSHLPPRLQRGVSCSEFATHNFPFQHFKS